MKRLVCDCDGCTLQNVGEGCEVAFEVDRVPDGAGGMEDVVETLDLCGECCRRALRKALGKLSHVDAGLVLASVRRKGT